MIEKFLETKDGIKIGINHYENQCGEVIILAHGWFMTKDSHAFKSIAKDLAKNFDVISMDFRGMEEVRDFIHLLRKKL